jgi:hypothetical protein
VFFGALKQEKRFFQLNEGLLAFRNVLEDLIY